MTFLQMVDLQNEQMSSGIANHDVDVISAFSADGRIQTFDMESLKNDKRSLPPYHAIPVMHRDSLLRDLVARRRDRDVVKIGRYKEFTRLPTG